MAQVKFKRGLFKNRGTAVNGMIYFATDTLELWMANADGENGWKKYGDGDERVKNVAYNKGVVTITYENGKTATTYSSLASVDTNAKDAKDDKFVTGVSATNGVVSATRSGITSSQVTRTATTDVTATTVEAAIQELATAVNTGNTNSKVTLETKATPNTGYLKTYTVKQGGNLVGDIDIPKDLVVTSGSLVNGTWTGDKFTEATVGNGRAIKLVIANQDAPIYINTTDLVDIYTAGPGVTVASNKISNDIDTSKGLMFTGSGDTAKTAVNVKSGDSYIEINSNGAIASKGIDSAISKQVKEAKDAIDKYKINDLEISTNPTLDGSNINVDKDATTKETVKDAIERLTNATTAASNKVDTEIAKLDGTAAASGTATAVSEATKTSYVNVLNKVVEVDGKVKAVSSGGSTLTAVDAAGAANAAYNDATLYTDTAISNLKGDATTSGDTLGELEDRIEALEGNVNGKYKELQTVVADSTTVTASDTDAVVTAVTQNANGEITVVKNVAGNMLMTNYAKPDSYTTTIAATDSINTAIGKLEAELTWIEA